MLFRLKSCDEQPIQSLRRPAPTGDHPQRTNRSMGSGTGHPSRIWVSTIFQSFRCRSGCFAGQKKKVMSAAARARIAAVQKARWAERKAKANPQAIKAVQTSRPKPKMSAAGRANIIAAQKARWAKIKAARPQPVRQAGSSVSAAARKKMAEAARARWARIRAAKGK